MEAAGGIAVLVVLFIVWVSYDQWKRRAVQSRSFTSRAEPDLIRDAFERKVATTGWKIVDDGNPMIAQSPLIAGTRQQVALELTLDGDTVRGHYVTLRYVRKMLSGTPTKAVTLAARKSAFFRELDRLGGAGSRSPRLAPSAGISAPAPSANSALQTPPTFPPTPTPSSPLPASGSPFAPQPPGVPAANPSSSSAQPWYAANADDHAEASAQDSPTPAPSQDEGSAVAPWWAS